MNSDYVPNGTKQLSRIPNLVLVTGEQETDPSEEFLNAEY